jgi:hypothetical protein
MGGSIELVKGQYGNGSNAPGASLRIEVPCE